MAEARFNRFRGISLDLPEVRNSEYAVDALNVYENGIGRLKRREGIRRLVEHIADAPVDMIASMPLPGGDYTGVGVDIIINEGGTLYHINPGVANDVRPGAAPEITAIQVDTVAYGLLRYSPGYAYFSFRVFGKNFHDEPGNRIDVSIAGDSPMFGWHWVRFNNPNHLNVAGYLDVENIILIRQMTFDVTVTNPDGQTATATDALRLVPYWRWDA